MGAANITETLHTSGSVTKTGTWVTTSLATASGGSYALSGAAASTVSITTNCRAVYALMTVQAAGFTKFNVAIDGVPQAGNFSGANGSQNNRGGGVWSRVLVPLARGLVDGSHTVTLTVPSGGQIGFNSFVAITGAKGTPTLGNLTLLGDSWTSGAGAYNAENFYANILTRRLQQATKSIITPSNLGISGTCLATMAGGTGGMYQLLNAVAATTPQYLTILYGVNDLHPTYCVSPADFADQVFNSLCFVEDAWDVFGTLGTPMTAAIGTPGYNFFLASTYQIPILGRQNYETAADEVRRVASLFSWARVADVYEAMDCRDELIWPNNNSTGDYGLHPNDGGHAVIADEFATALLLN